MRTGLLLVLRLCLGGVLCWAGGSKLTAVASFAESIANYRLLFPQANQVLAAVIPWWELSAGFLLICGVWIRPASLLACGLFVSFGLAVASALARGLNIDCGCFGTAAGGRIGLLTLSLDMVCGAVAALLVRFPGSTESIPAKSSPEPVRDESEHPVVQ